MLRSKEDQHTSLDRLARIHIMLRYSKEQTTRIALVCTGGFLVEEETALTEPAAALHPFSPPLLENDGWSY